MIFATVIAAGGAFATHASASGGSAQIELWQVINLIGAPMLAVLFVRPVIDDIRAWHAARRDEAEGRRGARSGGTGGR